MLATKQYIAGTLFHVQASINENLFEGTGVLTDSLIYPSLEYFPQVDQAVTKYPPDVRRKPWSG